MQPQNLKKIWRNYFLSTHIFSVIIASIYITCAIFAQLAEEEVLGDFPITLRITHTHAAFYFILAGFLLFIAILGVIAQFVYNRPGVWLLYCCLITFVTLAEIVGSVGVLTGIGSHLSARQAMKDYMEDYEADKNSPAVEYWDRTQQKFKCCGTNSYADWQDVAFGRTTLRTPRSCCLKARMSNENCNLNVLPDTEDLEKKIYTEGCIVIFFERIDLPLSILGGVGIVAALLHSLRTYLVCLVVITRRF